MTTQWTLLFSSLLIVYCKQDKEFRVALKCGHPVHYKGSQDNWVAADVRFNICGSEEEVTNEVFKICEALYPSINTETISEASAKEFVPGFCKSSDETASCFGIQYVCHRRNFVARSLLVPQNCTFGHKIADKCSTESELRILAQGECGARLEPSYLLHDYGVLPPACPDQVDKYNGVEFVCCPAEDALRIEENEKRLLAYQENRATKCRLQPESGPCFASLPSWYFDAVMGACFMFNYGGCRGNENRFGTKQQCLDTCAQFGLTSTIKPSLKPLNGDKSTEREGGQPEERDEETLGWSGSGSIIDEEGGIQKSHEQESTPDASTGATNKGGDSSSDRSSPVYRDLPFLMGGEPTNWFKVGDIALGIDFLLDDYTKPVESNEHDAYTKALVKLEDNYEDQMTGLMHGYEGAERAFVQAVQQSSASGVPNQPQLNDAFQRQIVQLYETATRELEDQYREVKAAITQRHRLRVAEVKRQRLQRALGEVQAHIQPYSTPQASHTAAGSGAINYNTEAGLMSSLTKYLDLVQDSMADEESHFDRIARLSYDRASVEHRQVVDNVYSAHDQGVQVCQQILQQIQQQLSYDFKAQLDIIMGEFDEYFSKVLANINDIARSIGFGTAGSEGSNHKTTSNRNRDTSSTFVTEMPKVEIEQSGVFAAKYMDKLPGLMKSESYDKLYPESESEEEQRHKGMKQTMYLVMFACVFVGCVVGTVVVSVMRNRSHQRRTSGGGGGGICSRIRSSTSRTFVRVDSNPHPLSPEEKHINSLQVNGYYNPIYKFFDDPQET